MPQAKKQFVQNKLKDPFDSTPLGIAVNTLRGIPRAFSTQIGQPMLRGYATIGNYLSKGPMAYTRGEDLKFKPEGNFQKDLYGTDKAFGSPLDAGLASLDLIPGGAGAKAALPAVFGAARRVKGAKGQYLTTKFLETFRDKIAKPGATFSRQEIEQFARRPELKKGEADLLLKRLKEFDTRGSAYKAGSKKTVQMFESFTNQRPVIDVDGVRFEVGSFGNNSLTRKVASADRFPIADIPGALQNTRAVIRASSDPTKYRYDNFAFLSPSEEGMRVVYGRENANGAMEILNAHSIPSGKLEKYLDDIGVPSRSRTDILSLERSGSNPLTYGDNYSIMQMIQEVKAQDRNIPARGFADSIRENLLKLKPVKVKDVQYDKTSIDGQSDYGMRGGNAMTNEYARELQKAGKMGKNYEEVVFESPITTNGSSHFPNSKNYFAHARGDEVVEGGKKIWREQEIQSDLLQKEGMERFTNTPTEVSKINGIDVQVRGRTWQVVAVSEDGKTATIQAVIPKEKMYKDGFHRAFMFEGKRYDGTVPTEKISVSKLSPDDQAYIQQAIDTDILKTKEAGQLTPFTNDRFGERIMRERIREKAQKGYSKYRLPTPETVGKIEGFEADEWKFFTGEREMLENVAPEDLKIGEVITKYASDDPRDSWIVTEILGGGRFKAVNNLSAQNHEPAYRYLQQRGLDDDGLFPDLIEIKNRASKEDFDGLLKILDEVAETQDLTGKSNPQARRYSDWNKFLKNKYGGKEVTDPQGNSWVEVDLKPEMGKAPIEAFGAGIISGAMFGKDNRKKKESERQKFLNRYKDNL